MARARRKDANQSEIEQVFKDAGCSVLDMSRLGDGVPDLLIGTPQGACFLVEVKTKRLQRSNGMLNTERHTTLTVHLKL